jgi:hypothetical protein
VLCLQVSSYERRQAELRRVQAYFGSSVMLVEPNRTFVREGTLWKLGRSEK